MRLIVFMFAFLVAAPSSYAQERSKPIGMQFDLGAPDGAALGLDVKPGLKWLNLSLAGTYNVLAPGIRAGITLDPVNFGVAPTLTAELGHAFSGTVPTTDVRLSYDYVNVQPGLEFGSQRSFRFFLRAGVSWINAKASNISSVIGEQDKISVSDPSLSARVFPTGKFGFRLYF